MKSQTRRKVPATKSVKAPHRSSAQTTALFQRPEPTQEESAAFSRAITEAHTAIAAAYPTRFDAPQNWRTWKEAVRQKYAVYKEYQTLWAQYFSREIISPEVARYNWDFWRDMELLKGGDATYLELAISFLESDPWFYGSGYAKEDIIPAINRLDLSQSFVARLQTVVLSSVDRRDRREFRDYCRLARKVDAPKLRDQLTGRLTASDLNIRRRARWVLEALERKEGMRPPRPNSGEPKTR